MKRDLTPEHLAQEVTVTLPLGVVLRITEQASELEKLRSKDKVSIGDKGLHGLYVGIAAPDTQGGDHILELLEEKPEGPLTWADAKAWAESLGGTLPTREQAALLFANAAGHFDKDRYYWTCDEHESDADYAWVQSFSDGCQGDTGKGGKYLARAVRRVSI